MKRILQSTPSFSFKDSTNFEGNIKMKGLPNFFETHIVGDVKRMNFTYEDIAEFAIPTPTRKIPLPEKLSSLKNAMLSGEFYGFHNNFNIFNTTQLDSKIEEQNRTIPMQ